MNPAFLSTLSICPPRCCCCCSVNPSWLPHFLVWVIDVFWIRGFVLQSQRSHHRSWLLDCERYVWHATAFSDVLCTKQVEWTICLNSTVTWNYLRTILRNVLRIFVLKSYLRTKMIKYLLATDDSSWIESLSRTLHARFEIKNTIAKIPKIHNFNLNNNITFIKIWYKLQLSWTKANVN